MAKAHACVFGGVAVVFKNVVNNTYATQIKTFYGFNSQCGNSARKTSVIIESDVLATARKMATYVIVCICHTCHFKIVTLFKGK